MPPAELTNLVGVTNPNQSPSFQGKMMQTQGIDDVSRGSLKTGVSIGGHMIQCCTWGRGAIDVEPQLGNWVKI